MNKYYCDKCGREISDWNILKNKLRMEIEDVIYSFDFCDDCLKKIKKQIME